MVVGFFGVWLILQTLPLRAPVNITTAECPALASEVKMVEMEGGWQCEEPESYSDLLQPSGYWINKRFDCWKMKQTIEEWRKNSKL